VLKIILLGLDSFFYKQKSALVTIPIGIIDTQGQFPYTPLKMQVLILFVLMVFYYQYMTDRRKNEY
jgi:hypothetical protein